MLLISLCNSWRYVHLHLYMSLIAQCYTVLNFLLLSTASPEYVLQAALREGAIPHHDHKFLIRGPGGVGKSSLLAMFLGEQRDLIRISTPLATEPLHLTPNIRDVSVSTLNTNWEKVDYERLSHMIAHTCYKRYLKGREGGEGEVKKESGGNVGEFIGKEMEKVMEEGMGEYMGESEVENTVESSAEDSQSLASAVKSVQESGGETQQQAELQQDEPEQGEVEDKDLPCLTTTLKNYEIQKVIEDFLQDLQEKIRNTTETNEGLSFHSIRILDSGGQPQFHELIAIFLSYISAFVSVFKLNENFSKYGEVVLYEDDKPINCPYKSHYSHEQVICHDLRAVQAEVMRRGEKEMPNIAFVGTFLDRANECKETPAMKDERLYKIITKMLSEEMQKCVITHGISLEQTMFQINARTPTKCDFDVVDELKGALLSHSQVQPRNLPLQWRGLEVALHVLMEKLNRQTLRRDECEVLAHNLNFNLVSFNEALDYLHKLNIIAYYRDVLPDVIFGSSQVVLSMITELVRYNLKLKGQSTLSGAERNFIQHGILPLEFLSSSGMKKHYIKELFQAEDLLKLLISLLVISPFRKKEFIMPCVLEVDKVCLPSSIPDGSVRSSFIFHFSDKSPMFGVYCCTVSSLISKAAWELLIEDGNVMQVARNSFTFKAPRDLPGKLIFRDPLSSYLEVILELPKAEHSVTLYREICKVFFESITSAMETLHYDVLLPKVSFLCPEPSARCSKEPHPGIVIDSQKEPHPGIVIDSQKEPHPGIVIDSQKYLKCSIKPSSVYFLLTEEQKMWQKAAGKSPRHYLLVCTLDRYHIAGNLAGISICHFGGFSLFAKYKVCTCYSYTLSRKA